MVSSIHVVIRSSRKTLLVMFDLIAETCVPRTLPLFMQCRIVVLSLDGGVFSMIVYFTTQVHGRRAIRFERQNFRGWIWIYTAVGQSGF